MGRSPCCEKLGLKRGPWSKEEDDLLINCINKNGHPNWRALPKLAGLLRCGKSCRLRWTNYLRPDIKRGNFTPEEEDTIIKLHKVLGNRWSAIASRLPGRTDNEIKNIWHTRLKKKMSKSEAQETPDIQEETPEIQEETPEIQEETMETSKSEENLDIHSESENSNLDIIHLEPENFKDDSEITSPKINPEIQQQPSSSVHSSSSMSSSEDSCSKSMDQIVLNNLLEVDDDFWSDVLWAPVDDSNDNNDNNLDLSLISLEENYQINSSLNDNWFWDDLFSRSNELMLELPEL